nr:hypothetical protein [Gloeochaete wittrockiana]
MSNKVEKTIPIRTEIIKCYNDFFVANANKLFLKVLYLN